MVGCGSKQDLVPTPPEPSVGAEDPSEDSSGLAIPPAAARIYMLGETRYAEGRFDEAVALWGHAMLQLPADPAADSVRHKLVARMGHGLLQAHGSTGDMSYLVDGQTLCELYIDKHEQLFGDGDEAKEQRGQIYELLYEFDSRLDGVVEEPVLADAADTTPADVIATPPASSTAESSEVDEAGEAGEDYRLVNVRRIAWADPEDPRVRAFAADERFTGPTKVDIGNEEVHGSRVLVRVGAAPRPTAGDVDAQARKATRKAGLAVVAAARSALEHCYEQAMTRDPVFAARVEVTLTVSPEGAVQQPRLVDGTVVDAEGDACAAEALRQVRLEPPKSTVALTMPIHFFYQETTRAAQLIRVEHPGTRRGYARTGRASGLPPITEFATMREPYIRPDPVKRTPGIMHLDPGLADMQRFPTE